MKALKLAIDIEDVDVVDLKITIGGLVGTLHIEKGGLSFSPPNKKNRPTNRIPFNQFTKVAALTNGFANGEAK